MPVLAADELGLDRRRGIDEAHDVVVDELAVGPADDDAPGAQGVPPLVVGEVVESARRRFLPDDGQPRRVGRHQQILLGDLDEAAAADVGPQRPQPRKVGRGRGFGEDAGAEADDLAQRVGHDRPRDRRDDEVRRLRAQELRRRGERGHAPARADLGPSVGGAGDDTGGSEAVGRRARGGGRTPRASRCRRARRRYSPTPIASTGRERSARRVGSARASSASSAETPRIAASWSSGT